MKNNSMFHVKRISPIFFIAILIFSFLCSCSLFQNNIAKEDIPIAAYMSARAAFNTHLKTYLNFRDMMPEGNKKQAFRNKYEDKFVEANKALDAWSIVVKAGSDPTAKAQAYTAIIDLIIIELINDDILKME